MPTQRRLLRRAMPALAAFVICAAARGGEMRCVKDKDLISIRVGEKTMLIYRRTPGPFKVYVKELRTPGGRQVLLDSPHDHVHHHALMYAIGVDEADFWGEFPQHKPGKQTPRGDDKITVSTEDGRPRATIEQVIDWARPGQKPLLEERRRITLYGPGDAKATLLTWSSRFTVGKGRAQAKLWGRHYFGLGMRFVRAMDRGAFFHPTAKAGKPVRGTEKLIRANWCAYHATLDGKPVTVAMFDHPGNPRHPATWFTMTAPFAYLTATLDLKKEPLVLQAGKTLHLVYGVALWDGKIGAEQVEKTYKQWVAQTSAPGKPAE